jgi:enoyl-CoA hydratase/carnithine racemase
MADVLTRRADGVLFVELNRPEKLNAMTSDMYLELADIFNNAAKDDEIRVVLWHGAGTAFSAGNDMADFLANPPAATESPQSRLMNALVDFYKPIVAAVRGPAIGGGTTMLLHCDFVYASETAKFQMPFINLAVPPEFGSTSLLPLAVGHLRSTELVLLGSSFDASRAAELGLVTGVVSDDTLLKVATETALELAAKPVEALQVSKRLLKDPFRAQIKAAIEAENEAFSMAVRSDEAREALTAFMERRPPAFSKASKPAAVA